MFVASQGAAFGSGGSSGLQASALYTSGQLIRQGPDGKGGISRHLQPGVKVGVTCWSCTGG